jgi:hypothetical protein
MARANHAEKTRMASPLLLVGERLVEGTAQRTGLGRRLRRLRCTITWLILCRVCSIGDRRWRPGCRLLCRPGCELDRSLRATRPRLLTGPHSGWRSHILPLARWRERLR